MPDSALCTAHIGKPARETPADNGGEEGDANRKTGPEIAEAQLAGHINRNNWQRYSHAEIGNEEDACQYEKAALRRVACLLESHDFLLAILGRSGTKKRTPITEDR
ncbi:hypothetical protein RvVAR0630_17550 [Agrobacterium vitis]|nr:hypothetical protein RvVAR0630_17550 [Agrobacterium vitis]